MTQTLNVEYQELMARAAEIEQSLPPIPATNPQGPCPLSFVNDAAAQIALSADSMRLYLKACEREWKTLATSLRNAAKAYEEADEGAAESLDAVNFDSSTSGATAGSTGGDGQMSALCDPDEDFGGYLPPPAPPPPPFQYPYYEVRQAAKDIESGDQGTAFKAFAADWDRFQRELQKETYRFRPFTSWEGESRTLVEQNFDTQRQWIYTMAKLCLSLGNQALKVADAHKKARVLGQHATSGPNGYANPAEHPTSYEVSQCDYWYKIYFDPNYRWPQYRYLAIEWYERLQAQSESSLSLYVANAGIPLQPVNPQTPPGAPVIKPPPTPPKPGDGDSGNPDNPNVPNMPDMPDVPDVPGSPDSPGTGLPDFPGDGSLPNTNVPTVPTAPSAAIPATPGANTAALNETLKDALKAKPGPPGGGVKPASVGGGGAGVPSMPLQPAADTGATAGPAGAGLGAAAAAAGRGMPGVGGAMGGGMGGGMAPMGGGQGQQNAGKGKRVQSDDESLYTEERQWTEGVVGNRPRKTGPPEK